MWRSGSAIRVSVLGALAIVLLLIAGSLASGSALDYRGSDFYCFWTAGRFVLAGDDPYDRVAWRAATGTPPAGRVDRPPTTACAARFAYPLWTALAFAPLGLLGEPTAASLWATFSIGATIGGTVLVWLASGAPRSSLPLLLFLVVASQPFALLLTYGQLVGVLLGVVGVVAWALARRRDTPAGVALAGLGLKPQLLTLFGPVLLFHAVVERRARLVAAAAVTGAALVLGSLALRPAWPLEWLEEMLTRRLRVAPLLPTAWGLAADAVGDPLWGAALVAIAAATVWLLVRGLRLRALDVAALSLPLSLFAAPHVWSYDFLVLALPWALIVAAAVGTHGLLRAGLLAALVACASVLPWLLYVIAFARVSETFSAVIPPLTALVLALALASSRRGTGALARR